MRNSPHLSEIDRHLSADFLASDPEELANGVKERLAVPIPGFDRRARQRCGFPAVKWLLSSAVQKLIRRGRAEQAVKTALALHALDPDYLPRRLPIIAIEDSGFGNPISCFAILHT